MTYNHTTTPTTPAGPAVVRHLTASMVVIDPDAGKVLLVDHQASGFLQFPGGHLDPDEDPGYAALREVAEETGVRARLACQPPVSLPGMTVLAVPWLVAEIPAPAKPDRGPGKPAEAAHSHIDFLFIGTASSTVRPVAQPDEVNAAVWVDINDLHTHRVRAEVPEAAVRAFLQLTRPAADGGRGSIVAVAGDGSRNVVIGGHYRYSSGGGW